MARTGAATLYVAAPLFSQAEWHWNHALASELRHTGYQVILPQEQAFTMLQDPAAFDARALFRANKEGLER